MLMFRHRLVIISYHLFRAGIALVLFYFAYQVFSGAGSQWLSGWFVTLISPYFALPFFSAFVAILAVIAGLSILFNFLVKWGLLLGTMVLILISINIGLDWAVVYPIAVLTGTLSLLAQEF